MGEQAACVTCPNATTVRAFAEDFTHGALKASDTPDDSHGQAAVLQGLQPLLTAWVAHAPPSLASHTDAIVHLFHSLVERSLMYVRHSLVEVVPSTNHALVRSLFRLLEAVVPWQATPTGALSLESLGVSDDLLLELHGGGGGGAGKCQG